MMNDHTRTPEDGTRAADSDEGVETESTEAMELVGPPSAESLGLSLPDDPDEARTILLHELADAREESGELLGNIQRLAAEFDNFRKRTERDQMENIQRAGQRVIEALLPALDSFDAALAIEATTETETRMLDGMRGTHALVVDALAREGFEVIDAIGQPFDPALHEAVSVVPGDGDQVVQQELRKGYVMRGRVIRPSLVIVAHA
jgi:molecular chaperone GrpE